MLFHANDWFVGGYDVDRDALDSLEAELGDRCVTDTLDVRDDQAFEQAMAQFGEASGGRLDVMFNNAGITAGGFLDDVPIERIRDTIDVNLLGVINGVRAAIPLLEATPDSLCFSTSSSAATFGTAGMATYAATKCAVKGLTEALSVELSRYGSRAADVSPGVIDTAIWESDRFVDGEVASSYRRVPERNAERTDAGRTLPPEDVAACVWEAYHSDRIHWYVPPEVADRDLAKATEPERLRDESITQLFGERGR